MFQAALLNSIYLRLFRGGSNFGLIEHETGYLPEGSIAALLTKSCVEAIDDMLMLDFTKLDHLLF